MLNQKELVWLLTFAYVGFAEWASTWWSKFPLCVLVSENQTTDNDTNQQTCATLFEGIVRLFRFFWEGANHDNVLAFGTIMIAVFTLTLWRSTRALWQAGEKQIEIAGKVASAAELNAQAVMDSEGAHLFPVIVDADIKEAFRPAILWDKTTDQELLVGPTVKYVIQNYGKTPAVLERIMHGISFWLY